MTALPVITDDVAALAYLMQAGTIDADLLTRSLYRVGRNSAPQIVSSLFRRGRLDNLDVLAVGVEAAWTGPDAPMAMLTTAEWVDMFEQVGYIVGTKRRPDLLPDQPIRLYRGAAVSGAFRWSWTDSVKTAQWFADRHALRGVGRIWTAEVAPHRLLAHFPDSRGEGEYVVDATGMAIEVHQ